MFVIRSIFLIIAALLVIPATGPRSLADDAPSYPKPPSGENIKVIPEDWYSVSEEPLTSQELDGLINAEHTRIGTKPARLTTDEQFIRRATLDLTGKLPRANQVSKFVRNRSSQKREVLIDNLLESEDYARHWAAYWTDVVSSYSTDMRTRRLSGEFRQWMAVQLKENRSWGDIAWDMLTAEGPLTINNEGENGAAYFLLIHFGQAAPVERAAATSRLFMGVQIQCAQCHDHPTDIWKREQFHQMAAFFARTRERRVRQEQKFTFALAARPRGEYRMPRLDEPKQSELIHPEFLTGKNTDRNQPDWQRRLDLAEHVTSGDNYWFSAAFANRIWGELMGQAFYEPVDNMGPLQSATMPSVLLRLASFFYSTDYDVKALFRVIMNSEVYQRQSRMGESPGEHLLFASTYPKRLRGDALYESLQQAIGPLGRRPKQDSDQKDARRDRAQGGFAFRRMVKETFDYDPSMKSDDVEGSIPQALFLMNNNAIQNRIRARGNTNLGKLLDRFPRNRAAIQAVYMNTLARRPTNGELKKCLNFVKKVGNRNEAFEDILWVLINSTEFQTKR